MRDPKRIPEILNQLKGIWSSFPDLRLGQLIINAAGMWDMSTMDAERKLYYMEDEQLIKLLRDHYSEVDYIENNKSNIQNSE
jgi:uncharacterized protein YihD (DUF1040 family)